MHFLPSYVVMQNLSPNLCSSNNSDRYKRLKYKVDIYSKHRQFEYEININNQKTVYVFRNAIFLLRYSSFPINNLKITILDKNVVKFICIYILKFF